MIGLMGAMQEEIELFTSYADVEKTVTKAGMKFYQGRLDDSDIVIVQCGIGKVNAAVSTQILIDHFDVDGVILAGLAGALVPYLQAGDIVMANYLIQYDVDLSAFGRRVGELPSIGRQIESDPMMLRQMTAAYDDIFGGRSNRPQLMVGTIVSGDRFISDKKTISWLQREFGAVATEMEGAAVAHVCQLNARPFLVVRTISDDASDGAEEQFSLALEMAPINTFAMIRRFIGAAQPEPVG